MICEKPSVAKSIASALGVTSRADGYFEGGGWLISWCIGHLVGLADAAAYDDRYKKWRYEDLPILPDPFRYVVSEEKADQFHTLRSLMERPDVTELVNACDAGREGELIFRLVYEAAGCSKPFSRLWISSMEDAAIREGFSDLRPGADYDPLYQSALCRQKADWLIGINASRLFSVLYHRTLNVGRVQTPTLAMLADRDSKIVLFHKGKYHHVRLALEETEAVSEKIPAMEDAQTIRDACDGQRAVCVSVAREKKTERPPKLYDLTTLQREANRVFGYTAKQTLDYAQSLYEKKLLTYPRTDSRYLTVDMTETASVVLHLAARVPPFDACPEFFPDVLALVNDKEVSDHHALIPTLELKKADVPALPVGERNILLLVCYKLLCAAAEPFVYVAVTATFDCDEHTFTAKGKQVLSQGWRAIQEVFRSSLKEMPEDEDSECVLPALTEGQVFEPVTASVTEHFTSPPQALHRGHPSVGHGERRQGRYVGRGRTQGPGHPGNQGGHYRKAGVRRIRGAQGQEPDPHKGRCQSGHGAPGAADLSQAHSGLGAAVERGGKGPGVAGRLHGRDRGNGGGAGAEILPHFREWAKAVPAGEGDGGPLPPLRQAGLRGQEELRLFGSGLPVCHVEE